MLIASLDEHLGRIQLADLFLDTFNFNAHTTASDALWVGCPVLTKMGKSFPARVAGSLLKSVELPELITSSEHEYEALALDLATNPERLNLIKRKLIQIKGSAPLFDTESYTKNLEKSLHKNLSTSCRRITPYGFPSVMTKLTVILPAAGKGTRLNLPYPKEILRLDKHTALIDNSFDLFKGSHRDDVEFVVVINENKTEIVKYLAKYKAQYNISFTFQNPDELEYTGAIKAPNIFLMRIILFFYQIPF